MAQKQAAKGRPRVSVPRGTEVSRDREVRRPGGGGGVIACCYGRGIRNIPETSRGKK